MLKKLKLLKKPLFQKRRWSCLFPPRKTLVAQKHRAISRPEKMAFFTSVGLSWDFPPPPTESVRTDGRTDVRTNGHVTITSEPKFLGLIVYQISLAMELRWRALPAGSAINLQCVRGRRRRYSTELKGAATVRKDRYLKVLTFQR